jgi:cellulose synthase/poly-beta-1,6-N-acetylglucosamine synthase-like glycosyltransferase
MTDTATEDLSLGAPESPADSLVSVIIPCLNEAESIEQCVKAAWRAMRRSGIAGEVIVADNGSEHMSSTSRAAATAAPTWRASEPRAARTC